MLQTVLTCFEQVPQISKTSFFYLSLENLYFKFVTLLKCEKGGASTGCLVRRFGFKVLTILTFEIRKSVMQTAPARVFFCTCAQVDVCSVLASDKEISNCRNMLGSCQIAMWLKSMHHDVGKPASAKALPSVCCENRVCARVLLLRWP